MTTPEAAWINGTPLQDLGLFVTGHPGWITGPEIDYPLTLLPGSIGGLVSETATGKGRLISVTAYGDPGTLTGREAFLNSINYRLKGLLELRFVDQPDKVWDVLLSMVEPVAAFPRVSMVEPGLLVTLHFLAVRPHKRDLRGRFVSFDSTRTQIPLGDLPSNGCVQIMGSGTNPTISYRAASGDTIQTLGMTITLASTDFLEIDMGRRTIHKTVSGTRTLVNEIHTSGYFFNPDPADGSPDWDDWPTLETDQGSGLYLYERNWSS